MGAKRIMKENLSGILVILFCSISLLSCSDDERLYFTQDEIIQGDISTGKQIEIKNITVYTSMSGHMYIQGGSGKISATSSDENIATVTTHKDTYQELIIKGVNTGIATITVTDEKGNAATLPVSVEDVETLWTTIATYKKTSLIEDECIITGVSDTEAASIQSDVLYRKSKESIFLFKGRTLPPSTRIKLEVYTVDSEKLYQLTGYATQEGFDLSNNDDENRKTYYFSFTSDEQGSWMVEDISNDYRTQYPNVQVKLRMAVQIHLLSTFKFF